MREFLFWSTLPWLLPQALWVRRTAPRFAGAAGPDQGLVPGTSPVRLLGIGDSVIAGVGARDHQRALVGQTAEALAQGLQRGVHWRALGRIGATSHDIRRELLPALDEEPIDFIVVSVGVNDLTSLSRTRRWRYSLSELLTTLRARAPAARLCLAGVPPFHAFPLLPQPLRALFGMRAETFDQVARELAMKQARTVYLPMRFTPDRAMFCQDGFHPSELGYAAMGQALAVALRSIDGN